MNGNYDLFGQTNGLSTNASISDSASMLDPNQGIYGCGVAPLLPQASQNLGYHQPPQYPASQEFFFLRERCKVLEQQLFKTTTECDTMKTLLDRLTSALPNLPAPGPAAAAPAVAAEGAINAEKYPNIHFWTQVVYNTWTNSPEGHVDPRWRVAYLEDEDGQTVPEETIKALRKKTRECWTELVEKNMAPKSWGKIRATAKDFAYSVIYKSFPFLQLCQNDWKLDLLCGNDYPGWVRNNLGPDGKWAVKQEDTSSPEPPSQPSPSKKRKGSASVKAPRTSDKRIKNNVQEPLEASWCFNDTDLNAPLDSIPTEADVHSSFPEPVNRPQSPPLDSMYVNIIPTANIDLSSSEPAILTTRSAEDSTTSVNTIPTAVDMDIRSSTDFPQSSSGDSAVPTDTSPTTIDVRSSTDPMQSSTSSTSPDSADSTVCSLSSGSPLSTSDVSSPTNPTQSSTVDSTESTHTTTAVNISLTLKNGPNPVTASPLSPDGDSNGNMNQDRAPVIINPIASLNKKSLKIKLPPLPALPANVAQKKNDCKNETEEPEKTSSGKRKATSRKMRPTKNKTAYNLCAHRWLAQVNENGSSDEFRAYWNKELNESQREAYKKEVKELVDGNTWGENVASGTLY